MSDDDDKKLKSTQMIFGDRLPTQKLPDEQPLDQTVAPDAFRDTLVPGGGTPSGGETQIFLGDAAAPVTTGGGAETEAATTIADSSFHDATPTTGWLVIIKGPGRGNSMPLTYGRNTVGRDPDQTVTLDFGDQNISRQQQIAITYDVRSGKFYCGPGGEQKNLCYIGGEPLLSTMELDGPTEFEMGETTVRFVPLCGPDFNWV